jgi:hypothetical protein
MKTFAQARRPLVALSALVTALSLTACDSSTDEGTPLDPPVRVTVSPSGSLLVSLGDDVQLSATVTGGDPRSGSPAVSWSASPAGVVSVDASGRVVAAGNGVATVTATAASATGAATVTVEQVVDSVVVSGDAQAADVGAPLDSAVVLTLYDARNNPVAGAPVAFNVLSGGGSVSAPATSDAAGRAAAVWTLGPGAGIQEIETVAGFSGEVTRYVTANGYPREAAELASFSGDTQQEIPLSPLPQPLQVQVRDSLGNGVPGMLVTFAVSGDATLDAAEAYTDLAGVAGVALTLGSALGAYTVTAAVPDSMTVTGLPLDGSPVVLAAEAVAYTLEAPPAMTVGDTVTVTGTGFHPTLPANRTYLGGKEALLLSGSQTRLTFQVPDLGCTPEREVELVVERPGQQAVGPALVTPAGALALAVGERRVFAADESFCLQFRPGADDDYLVGLTLTRWFDGGTAFAMTAQDALGPVTSPFGAGARAARVPVRTSSPGPLHPELRLRAYEETLVARLVGGPLAAAGSGRVVFAPATAVVGEELEVRLPDLRGDACVDYVPVTARVVSAGERLTLATSAALPAQGSLAHDALMAAVAALQESFGEAGLAQILALLGAPTAWGTDAQVTVILTPEVADMGLPAYASLVDQLPRTACPSSDESLYLYVAIPDGASSTELAQALVDAPPELAHHAAHLLQWAHRLAAAAGGGGVSLLPAWLAEGQAELVVEHVGLALAGLGPRQDLGAAVLADPDLAPWIAPRFDRLARFQGWDGGAGTVAGAPEGCSLFGFGGGASPCAAEAGPGAAWSFLRYLADRFGPGGPQGDAGLQQALLQLDLSGDLVAQMEALLGVTLGDLVVDWAGMLYADGRLTSGEAPLLQLSSWRLDELLTGARALTPPSFAFADFVRDGTVVGGGTAYARLASAGLRGALAVAVHDGQGGPVSSLLRPRLWVLRLR